MNGVRSKRLLRRHLEPPPLSCRIEEEAAANMASQKKIKELEAQILELDEDLEREKFYRSKNGQRCKELEKELEAIKNKLDDTLDTTAAQQELR